MAASCARPVLPVGPGTKRQPHWLNAATFSIFSLSGIPGSEDGRNASDFCCLCLLFLVIYSNYLFFSSAHRKEAQGSGCCA